MKTKAAFITPIVLFVVFTALLLANKIGELSYFSLNALSILVGVVIYGFDRLQEVDFKNLKMVLSELKQAKEELFVREEKLKEITFLISQIMAFTGYSGGRFESKESLQLKRAWYRYQINKLKEVAQLNNSESKELDKFFDVYSRIDTTLERDLKPNDPDYQSWRDALEHLVEELKTLLQEDIERHI